MHNTVDTCVVVEEGKARKYFPRCGNMLKYLLLAVTFFFLFIPGLTFNDPFSCLPPDVQENSTNNETCLECNSTAKCVVTVVPVMTIVVIEATQVLEVLCNMPVSVLVLCRCFQVIGITILQIFIQTYQSVVGSTKVMTPGYIGFALLCGYTAATFMLEMPEIGKKIKKLLAVMCIVTVAVIPLIADAAMNQSYQTWKAQDFIVFFGSLCGFIIVSFILFQFLRKIKTEDVNIDFQFVMFMIGLTALLIILVPSSQFSVVIMQIAVVYSGITCYVVFYICTIITQL